MIDTRELNILAKALKTIVESEKIDRIALMSIHQLTAKRIFQDGINANGKLIGVYSPAYLKTRAKKNYPSSRKVIFQATGQMVNDYTFLTLRKNNYGSGFKFKRNFDISEDLEKKYGEVWNLTKSEENKISIAYDDAIKQLIK